MKHSLLNGTSAGAMGIGVSFYALDKAKRHEIDMSRHCIWCGLDAQYIEEHRNAICQKRVAA